ncbi:potassium transporter TrkA [Pilimelia terevasa]|uniref:Potassium transporter TrkA n=1 Tax=Pilimelia terevasa TaxID=53372 RepID=A0A8J3BVF4_9ACTN|nr:cation:proton antiporter regulatory subunit [Pilimelia terevasa]GGK35354.1 potassium transporter TrkA [Pilimelia terevasa]
MQVRIEQSELPGIGVRHDLLTASHRRVGVVTRRNGRRDLVVYSQDDPDASAATIPLTNEEADALASLLGASLILEQLASLREQAAGLLTEQVPLTLGTPYVDRALGDAKIRTRTSASIVAVLRGSDTIPSPGPAFIFAAGDVVVLVGTRPGLDSATRLLTDADPDD